MHLCASRGARDLARFAEPRIEPELVLHFRSTPPLTDDPAEILACIDWIAHGIEIVQSHFPGWKFRAADTVADWALHGTLLVGEPQSVERLGRDLVFTARAFYDLPVVRRRRARHGAGLQCTGQPAECRGAPDLRVGEATAGESAAGG